MFGNLKTWLILTMSLTAGGINCYAKADCFSCEIHVNNLEDPLDLRGNWLFTKEDHPTNKNSALDDSRWKQVVTPGHWKNIYDDGKPFSVGWYRGYFKFHPDLVGKKVVLLMDTYMGEFDFYVDGRFG